MDDLIKGLMINLGIVIPKLIITLIVYILLAEIYKYIVKKNLHL